jgi:hypothetical protein
LIALFPMKILEPYRQAARVDPLGSGDECGMTDGPLDEDLAKMRALDERIEGLLKDANDSGRSEEGPTGAARVEFDRLVDERSQLLQRINRETPSSRSDDIDRGPHGSGPRPAG